ncbi:uncharacterized protein LOC108339110 [Vigna angularis]|uniref:uncharacterized protein LOC108339110 n=1 Tax=Phaseolus angularis TaxID=3914 RepID=UPI0022B4BB59|nr:uncharacterized protein LOC108339110 [Vigna angularis]
MADIRPMKPLQPPYPHNYDPNARCNFHGGSIGHSTERCMGFKFKVQSLIDVGWLKFQKDKPSIEVNPLAEHGNASTNAIEVGRHKLVRNVSEIRSYKKIIFEKVVELGLLRGKNGLGEACGIHPRTEHVINQFRSILQDLIDRSCIQIYYEDKVGEVFAQTGGESNMTLREPLVIRFTRTPPTLMRQGRSAIVIQIPSPFAYRSDKTVPWKYDTRVIEEECDKSIIKSISGIGRMTKSGRISPPSLLTKEDVELSEEKIRPSYKNVKEIFDEEKVVNERLDRTHVEHNISLDRFEGIVNNITANDYLTFTDEEIPAEGRRHNKALHISVKCLDHAIAHVLIDNGSSLNVMPKVTLEKLPYDVIHLKPSIMIIRAFDGSKRDVMGEIDFPVQVGPCVFQITFQIMDIHPAYNCLLGRPWIHSAGVVPSTLHQKLKYVMDNQLIIVSGEEDFLVRGPLSTRYIEAAEEALETAFQSLEIIGNTYIESMPVNSYMSCASLMIAKVMLKEGFKHGKGLGKDGPSY